MKRLIVASCLLGLASLLGVAGCVAALVYSWFIPLTDHVDEITRHAHNIEIIVYCSAALIICPIIIWLIYIFIWLINRLSILNKSFSKKNTQ